MLPTTVELREQSRRYQEAARTTLGVEAQHQLAACALALAQIAEQIEREGEVFATRLNDLLAALDEDVRRVVEMLLSELETQRVTRSRVSAWRTRAEELRTIADQFSIPSAQESLRRAASNYDKLAEDAEKSLEARLVVTGEVG
jgi:hypothetical protein